MSSRRRVPRSIVGAWGVQTNNGPMCWADGTPCLQPTKAQALDMCTVVDMQPVRVTVRYPLSRTQR